MNHYCDGVAQCGPICGTGYTWDCSSSNCVCNTGTNLCQKGTICCETCENDLCCSKSQQSKSGCCGAGTAPSIDGLSCDAVCGPIDNAKSCNESQSCNKVSGLSNDDLENLQKSISPENWRGVENGNAWFCSDPSSCTFSESSGLPWGDYISGGYTNYILDGFYGPGNTTGCFPTDSNPTYDKCYTYNDETKCTSDNNCESIDIFDGYVRGIDIKTKMTNLMKYQNKEPLGYYCDPYTNDVVYARLEKTTAESNSECTVFDCIKRISNDGTTQVDFDADNGVCTALKTSSAQGVTAEIRCTDKGIPCPDCNKAGDMVPNCKTISPAWKFKKCTDSINGINTKVLNYTCANPKGCNEPNNYIGNCPWGGNDTSNGADYAPETKYGTVVVPSHGAVNNSLYCTADSQIEPITNIQYKLQPSASNHGSVCTPTVECSATDECYVTLPACVAAGECDIKDGWNLSVSSDGTRDCDIFACTKTGEPMDITKPSNNGDAYWDYYNNKCLRKYPTENPDMNNHCYPSAESNGECAIQNPIYWGAGWGNANCKSTLSIGCSPRLDDYLSPGFNGNPNYYRYFPSDQTDPTSKPCWESLSEIRSPYGFQTNIFYNQTCPKDCFPKDLPICQYP
jgi:hypothetical protein